LTERVAARPVASGSRFIDNRHQRCSRAVRMSELAPTNKRDPPDPEPDDTGGPESSCACSGGRQHAADHRREPVPRGRLSHERFLRRPSAVDVTPF
jgi:hypothetical protein